MRPLGIDKRHVKEPDNTGKKRELPHKKNSAAHGRAVDKEKHSEWIRLADAGQPIPIDPIRYEISLEFSRFETANITKVS